MLAVYLVVNAAMAVALWQNWKLIEMGCLAPGAVATVSRAYNAFTIRSLLITILSLISIIFFASMLISIERKLEMQCTDIFRAIFRVRKGHFGPLFNTSYKVHIQCKNPPYSVSEHLEFSCIEPKFNKFTVIIKLFKKLSECKCSPARQ
jgi:hypothetical protein